MKLIKGVSKSGTLQVATEMVDSNSKKPKVFLKGLYFEASLISHIEHSQARVLVGEVVSSR